jgi:outer membrane lipoprotein-sorting protein
MGITLNDTGLFVPSQNGRAVRCIPVRGWAHPWIIGASDIHSSLRVLAAVGLVVLATTVSGWACDSDSILNSFEGSLPVGQVTQVKYHKVAHSLLFGERPAENGTLWLGPPKRYRVETQGQTIVRGNDTLWSYAADTKQVTLRVGDLDSLEFGPAGFFGSLRKDFITVDCALDTIDTKEVWRLRLAARTETAAIQRLALWIDPATWHAQQAEYVDYNEETARLTFTDYQLEKSAASERFGFAYPKGVERIVLPASKGKKQHVEEGE